MAVKTVLLVDDSKSARLVLRKMLEKNSLNVDLAESAEDAFTYLLGRQPDAIFMDHLMPGMDGLEATEVILKNPATQSIPIVMCTSKEGSEFTREARLRGVMDILPKPPSPGAVTKVLKNISEYNNRCAANAKAAINSSAGANAESEQALAVLAESAARKVAGELFEARMNDGEVMQRWVGPVLEEALRKLQEEVLEVSETSARNIAEEIAAQDSQALKQSIQTLYDLVESQNEAPVARQTDQTSKDLELALGVIREKLEQLGEADSVDEKWVDDKLERFEKQFPDLIEQEIASVANSLKEDLDDKVTVFQGSIVHQVEETVETFKKEFSTELDLLAHQNEENKDKIKNLQLVESSVDANTDDVDETLNLRLKSLESEVLNKAKSHTQSVADNVFQLIEDIQPTLNQGSLDSLKGEMVQIIQLKEAALVKKIKMAALVGGGVGVIAAMGAMVVSKFLF